jgi:Domain of unknown function (DUF4145)
VPLIAAAQSQDAFRQRALPPEVFEPIRRQLGVAHRVLDVLGTPFAALALMRSIMEALLRDHYGAEGKDLEERINQARKRLPSGGNAAALHRLRRLANAILHLNPEKDEGLPKIEPIQLEKEIVSLLFVLRALIEATPQWRTYSSINNR